MPVIESAGHQPALPPQFSYKFHNLLGAPFGGGSVTFTPDGNSLLVAAGNRPVLKDLISQSSFTLAAECPGDIDYILTVPPATASSRAGSRADHVSSGRLILLIDEAGRVVLVNLNALVPLARVSLKSRVTAAAVSPDGKYVAMGHNRRLSVWHLPSAASQWQFTRIWEQLGHTDTITSVQWSPVGHLVLTASSDTTVKVWAVHPPPGFVPLTFVDHRSGVRFAGFSADGSQVTAVSREGVWLTWRWEAACENNGDDSSEVMPPPAKKSRALDTRASRFLKRGHQLMEQRLAAKFENTLPAASTQDAPKMKPEDTTGGEHFPSSSDSDSSLESSNESESETEDLSSSTAKRKIPKSSDRSQAVHPTLATSAATTQAVLARFTSGIWTVASKVFLGQPPTAKVSRCAWFPARELLAVGLTTGVMIVYQRGVEVEGGRVQLSAAPGAEGSDNSAAVSTLAFNSDGDWVAAGCREGGVVAVWEWMSETYVLREVGDRQGIRCADLMPAGALDPFAVAARRAGSGRKGDMRATQYEGGSRNIVAAGSMAGSVKLWDASSGRQFANFHDAHSGPVVGVVFTPQLNAVVSAGQDGTLKAFDLLRAKKFRSMQTPELLHGVSPQLSCLAIDAAGEILAAGSAGSDCKVYIFALQTGKFIDALSGHEGPVTKVAFSPSVAKAGVLATASLDGTVRVWDIFGRVGKGGVPVVLECGAPVMTLAWSPKCDDTLVTSLTGGTIAVWDTESEELIGTIDGMRDIAIGRMVGDRFARNNMKKGDSSIKFSRDADPNAYFSSVCFAGYGDFIVAACQESPQICVYSTLTRRPVMTFRLSHSSSLQGLLRELNSKYVTDSGIHQDDIEISDDEAEADTKLKRLGLVLPGSKVISEAQRKRFLVWQVCGSTDSESLTIATSHGLFQYTVDSLGLGSSGLTKNHVLFAHLNSFAPVALSDTATRAEVTATMAAKEFPQALRLALGLNDAELIAAAYSAVSPSAIRLTVALIPQRLLPALLNFLRLCLAPHQVLNSGRRAVIERVAPRLQFHLAWLVAILTVWQPDGFVTARTGGGSHETATNFAAGDSERQLLECRTLLLMALKQLQETKGLLSNLFEENRHAAAFLASMVRAATDGDKPAAALVT